MNVSPLNQPSFVLRPSTTQELVGLAFSEGHNE
jgi:hypothetical protein